MANKRLKSFVFLVEVASEPAPSLLRKVRLWHVFTYVSGILIGLGPLVFPNITNLCPNIFCIWWVLWALINNAGVLYSPRIQQILALNSSMWSGQGSGWGWGRKPSGVHGSEQSPNPPGCGFENSAQGGPSPSFIGRAWGRPPPRACAERGLNRLQQGGPRHRAAPGVGPSTEAIDGDAEVHYRARSCLRL